MKILFASNSRFGEIILEGLSSEKININFLATASDKKRGRGQELSPSAIKVLAEEKGIEVLEVDDKKGFQELVEKLEPEITIVVGFSIIINKETIKDRLFINVHPSLLPKHRGPTPIQTTIRNGESVSGVTIIRMDEKIDHGPIILKKEILLDNNIDYVTAEKVFANVGVEMLKDLISRIKSSSLNLEYVDQNEEEATCTKKLTKDDGSIIWSDLGIDIERKIRAYNDWPGSYTYLNGKRLKIIKASYQKQTLNGPFGEAGKTYLGTNNTIAVQTGRGFLLIEKLQLEGKNIVSAEDFLKGNISIIGSVLSSPK